LLTILGLGGLLFLAWPGWLQPHHDDPGQTRRVAWGVEGNPSWQKTAEQLAAWRRQGLIPPEARGVHFSPGMAHYCAWFCPEEKDFFDQRFALFPKTTADFLTLRRVFRPAVHIDGKPPSEAAPWRRVFRQAGVTHVILPALQEQMAFTLL